MSSDLGTIYRRGMRGCFGDYTYQSAISSSFSPFLFLVTQMPLFAVADEKQEDDGEGN
jgi:hypothetical protein